MASLLLSLRSKSEFSRATAGEEVSENVWMCGCFSSCVLEINGIALRVCVHVNRYVNLHEKKEEEEEYTKGYVFKRNCIRVYAELVSSLSLSLSVFPTWSKRLVGVGVHVLM